MNAPVKIRWGLVLLGGIAGEVLVGLILAPVAIFVSDQAMQYSAPAASFVGIFLWAAWLGHRLESRFVLHGLLMGCVAIVFYTVPGLAFSGAQALSLPPVYILAHVLKLAGGATGGLVAQRRKLHTSNYPGGSAS